ncbi:MAG: integrase, partial [Georgfuchsia sp.]
MRGLGVTGHGLRHEVLIRFFGDQSGEAPPVRGGGPLPPNLDRAARQAVSQLAGHVRTRAAGAYLGASPRRAPPDENADAIAGDIKCSG